MGEVLITTGGTSVDDRGTVRFVNDFTFDRVKRFYTVSNHSRGFVRAWHGHKYEEKWVHVVHGVVLFAFAHIPDFDNVPERLPGSRTVLTADNPSVLHIPGGYIHGFKTLVDAATVMFFSSMTLEESKKDDYRLPAHQWDVWEVEER